MTLLSDLNTDWILVSAKVLALHFTSFLNNMSLYSILSHVSQRLISALTPVHALPSISFLNCLNTSANSCSACSTDS